MKAAEAKPELTVVRDGELVAVVGPTEHAAAKGVDSIKAEWKDAPKPVGAKELFKHLKDTARRGGGGAQGSIDAGIKAADKTVKTTYTIAYIAHVPLEPRVAVAEWEGDKVTVWTGTRRPFGVRGDVAHPERASRRTRCGSSYRTWAQVTAASTASMPQSRPRSSRRRWASRYGSRGRARKSSRGRTSAPRA